jgi:5-methylcytosine-specific restriction endonuclease McrA
MVVHQDAKARQLDALEMILAEWEQYTGERWRHWWSRATAEQRAKFMAKERDQFQCLRCGKTRLNQGSLESHHIVPKGARGDPMYEAMERIHGINSLENLATLCTDCHHNYGHAGWRKAARWLLAKIGTVL